MSMYSQASQAQYTFLYLESRGVVVAVVVKRSTSPLLQPVKQLKREGSSSIHRLQKILGADTQPKSHGQAQALELVYTATATQPQIIILTVFAARFTSNQAADWLGREPLGPCTPYLGFQKLGIRVSYRIARIFIIQLTLRYLLSLYNYYYYCPK